MHLLVVLLVAVGAGAGLGYVARAWYAAGPAVSPAEAPRRPLYYRHPMDPSITSPVPAKDSMGMDYLPVYADGDGGADAPPGVAISAAVRQSLGVRTAPARRAVLGGTVRATGVLAWDESRLVHLHTRVPGWVRALHVHAVGDAVRAGQVLATLDSNVLDAAQREHLAALEAADAQLVAASRQRLAALGMTATQIDALARSGRPSRAVAVRAPADGVVIALGARHGMYVTPGDELFALAALDPLWVDVEVLERDAPAVHVGAPAWIELPAEPGRARSARVDYVYPQVDARTRAQRVRVVVENPDGALRAGMWAAVRIGPAEDAPVLAVAQEAVIRTGRGARVVLARPDGRFAVREVRIGRTDGGLTAVHAGLEEGDEVVVSAQFLLDAEADVHAALAALDGHGPSGDATPPPGHDVAGQGAPADRPAPPVRVAATVRALDAPARRITLEHGAIEALGMPAMTMPFDLAAGVDLAGVAVGRRVHVDIELSPHGYVVTAIAPADAP